MVRANHHLEPAQPADRPPGHAGARDRGPVSLGINLNVEAYPDPTPPLVEVITQNPGASPEEMERLIGIPIEIALNGMPGLDDLRSTSIAGLNDIKCQFTYGTDYWKARQEVINRIDAHQQSAARA